MTRRLLNRSEEVTADRLRSVCAEWGAHVYPKVRVADVLSLDRSVIGSDLYGYGLQAHFDFTVCNKNFVPLFAVEFDGPSHHDPVQRRRDLQKEQICWNYSFPLLRVNDRYLDRTCRTMDLLTWFVEAWFLKESFDEGQRTGAIAPDEPFDAKFVWRSDDRRGPFPMWLISEINDKVRELSDAGRCWSPGVSSILGVDARGTYHAVGYLEIDGTSGVVCQTAMRAQQFPIEMDDILPQIVEFQVYERLEEVLSGAREAEDADEIVQRLQVFTRKCHFVGTHSCSRGVPGGSMVEPLVTVHSVDGALRIEVEVNRWAVGAQ